MLGYTYILEAVYIYIHTIQNRRTRFNCTDFYRPIKYGIQFATNELWILVFFSPSPREVFFFSLSVSIFYSHKISTPDDINLHPPWQIPFKPKNTADLFIYFPSFVFFQIYLNWNRFQRFVSFNRCYTAFSQYKRDYIYIERERKEKFLLFCKELNVELFF